jgi:hypothetical protein
MNDSKTSKMVQKFVLGVWDYVDGRDVFTECLEQPKEDITNFAEMLAWARKNYGEVPGTFSFIRKIPGSMSVARQTSFFAKFGMDPEDTVEAICPGTDIPPNAEMRREME